jgi:hypothetical protein
VSYTLALKRLDPFGKRGLGACFACGESITWEDDKVVHVVLREEEPVQFHTDCFEQYRAGLNLFASLVLNGSDPELAN